MVTATVQQTRPNKTPARSKKQKKKTEAFQSPKAPQKPQLKKVVRLVWANVKLGANFTSHGKLKFFFETFPEELTPVIEDMLKEGNYDQIRGELITPKTVTIGVSHPDVDATVIRQYCGDANKMLLGMSTWNMTDQDSNDPSQVVEKYGVYISLLPMRYDSTFGLEGDADEQVKFPFKDEAKFIYDNQRNEDQHLHYSQTELCSMLDI